LLFGPCACLATVAALAQAATFDDAPEECRRQVHNALDRLKGLFTGRAAGAPLPRGSLENAITAYVPAKFHRMDEGTIPPRHPTASDTDGGATARMDAPRCPDELEVEMTVVDGRFCIDRWEASVEVQQPDGALGPHSPYTPLDETRVYFARSRPGVIPQAYVSAQAAGRACRAAGKRLCSPVEWRVACAGSKGTAFPYGGTRRPRACHDSGTAPMLVFYASTKKRGWGLSEMNDPRLNQLEGTVAKTGTHPDCVNDYGAFDMVGNLHEWTDDPNGTFQGGFWLDTKEHGEGCAYRTIAHPADYHDYSTGFRCCADIPARAKR
jgi:hypothetical protein